MNRNPTVNHPIAAIKPSSSRPRPLAPTFTPISDPGQDNSLSVKSMLSLILIQQKKIMEALGIQDSGDLEALVSGNPRDNIDEILALIRLRRSEKNEGGRNA